VGMYRAQVVIERQPDSRPEDVAVNTFTISTGGSPGDTNEATANDVADSLQTLYGGPTNPLTLHMTQWFHVARIKVYAATEEGPPLVDRPQLRPGAATAQMLPLQVAISVTFRTQNRKRWGRVYLPGATVAQIGAGGRILPAVCDTICESFAAWSDGFDAFGGASFNHVTTSMNADALGAPVSNVVAYQVDDVPDVIRSRRSGGASYRKLIQTRDLAF
jgi:hypothetical protein